MIAELTSRLRPGEVVAFPAALGIAAPHEVWSELEHGLGRPVFEVPTLPPSVPGMRVFAVLRDALRRAGGSLLLNNVVVGAEQCRRPRRTLRVRVGLREERHSADWIVLATGGFASGGLELDSDWTARETALGLPVAGVPEPGAPRFEPQLLRRASDGARGRRCRRPAAARWASDGFENVLVAGATLGGRRAVEGEVRRRAQSVDGAHGGRARAGGVRGDEGGDRVSDDVLGTLLMRESLDHCVKCTICETFCPVVERHAAVSRAQVRGAAVGALPGRRRAVAGRVAGLLLRVRDLHSGVPAGRAHRGDQHAGAREAPGDDRRQAARPRDRAADADGPAGTPAAPVANWSLSNPAFRLLVEKTIGIHRRAPVPKFAGRTFQRWARKHTSPPAERRVAFFHGCGTNYFEPRLGEMTVELLEHNGIKVEVPKQDCCGLPLAVERAVQGRAGVRAPAGRAAGARSRVRASTSSARRPAAR